MALHNFYKNDYEEMIIARHVQCKETMTEGSIAISKILRKLNDNDERKLVMTEKEVFLQEWEREFQTNLKLLNALPESKLDIRPDANLHSAKDLAWSFVREEKEFIGGGLEGKIDLVTTTKPPSTLKEIITAYEHVHKDNVQKVRSMNDADFTKSIKGFSSPKLKGDVRRADILWGGLMDGVHQRGQFSIYLSLAGANVPQATYAPITMHS